jgi:hypothetical protein
MYINILTADDPRLDGCKIVLSAICEEPGKDNENNPGGERIDSGPKVVEFVTHQVNRYGDRYLGHYHVFGSSDDDIPVGRSAEDALKRGLEDFYERVARDNRLSAQGA